VAITGPGDIAVGLDAAQYGMLQDQLIQQPNEAFLCSIVTSCRSQSLADSEYHVPWSRHLLSCLHHVLEIDLLVGARAVTYNPHFAYFCSPGTADAELGSAVDWKPLSMLLLLDSFAPENRTTVLDKALQHSLQHKTAVWILRYDQPSMWAVNDLEKLRALKARVVAALPAKSLILHDVGCWSYAKWDSKPSRYNAQLWQLSPLPNIVNVQTLLGNWDVRRYDFHHNSSTTPQWLKAYRNHQQDCLRFAASRSTDYFAGTDGSSQRQSERQGSGFVVTQGDDTAPVLQFFAPVGGPLSSIRVEAVALLCLLEKALEQLSTPTRLTVFIDSLCLLDVLLRWGKSNFWPAPMEIIHFDVLLPLIQFLRKWPAELTLVKVKGHTGCLHNEMADEQADRGCQSDAPKLHNGPQKYGTLHLTIQPALREMVSAENPKMTLPSDLVPNKSILRQVVRTNLLRAVRLRSTSFARDLVQTDDGLTVARTISKHKDSEVRCWMQAMTGTYPVATYLKRIGKIPTSVCPYCSSQQDETFTHFMSVCPRFHDARVAAHNQIRESLSGALRKALPKGWLLHEETPMARTGLKLTPVSTERVQNSGRSVKDSDIAAGTMQLDRWQPDLVVVSDTRRKIAIVDVIRPSDIRRVRLQAAYQDKMRAYEPLCDALSHYSSANWEIRILPWVVGTRGLVRQCMLNSALEFLEVPCSSRQQIIEKTVHASVTALVLMHRARFSHIRQAQSSSVRLEEALARRGIKRKGSNRVEDLTAEMTRWKRMAVNTWQHKRPAGNRGQDH